MNGGLTSADQEDRCVSECCAAVVYTSFPPPFSLLPRLLRYGPNSLDVPVKPYHVLLIEEVLHPFYIFEVLTVIFWMMDDYYYYAGEEVGSGEELGGGRGGGGGWNCTSISNADVCFS